MKSEQWEYQTRGALNVIPEKDLNALGKDGWELIAIAVTRENEVIGYFKRKKPLDE